MNKNNSLKSTKIFNRILIANRGEVALRIIKACKELGIETVAVYSEADKNSPHLNQADIKICIGPGQSSQSYLNREAILQAAINTECQALHPGFGFLAEDALFANMCEQNKLTFIGPTSNSIRLMGNKSQAKQTMKNAGLPTIPGTEGNIRNLDEAVEIAKKYSYPVLLKATSGGGGKGIRPCNNEKELRTFYPQAKMEAEKAFGDSSLYLEKLILNGHHIEFQILADSYNNVIHLGERECSIQRKNQKLIEESPSPAVDSKLRDTVGANISESIQKIGYLNAGTIEFLMDENKNLYFMEMNTRLQVEHPVTEMITGVDIVREQDRTTMYDIKAHDPEYVRAHKNLYQAQLNVYAHIWQELRQEDLDATAIIATTFPPGVRRAMDEGDEQALGHALEAWEPLIPLDYDLSRVEETVQDFGTVVDAIEGGKFAPRTPQELGARREYHHMRTFATDVCRNCDARFSCASYRRWAAGRGSRAARLVRQYFAVDDERWREVNLAATPESDDLTQDFITR